MMVELVRGPFDGMIYEVPSMQPVLVISQAPMSAAEFVEATEKPTLLEFSTMVAIEHAYIRDQTALSAAGYQRYIYGGVRQQK